MDVTLVGAGGEYMDAAVLIEWTVEPGATVEAGQVLAVVETAKAATEVVAPGSGTVLELLAKPGDEIKVGAVLARIGTDAEAAKPEAAAAPAIDIEPEASASGLTRRLPKVFASPLAKRIARDRGIDLTGVKGRAAVSVASMSSKSSLPLPCPPRNPWQRPSHRRRRSRYRPHRPAARGIAAPWPPIWCARPQSPPSRSAWISTAPPCWPLVPRSSSRAAAPR